MAIWPYPGPVYGHMALPGGYREARWPYQVGYREARWPYQVGYREAIWPSTGGYRRLQGGRLALPGGYREAIWPYRALQTPPGGHPGPYRHLLEAILDPPGTPGGLLETLLAAY